ncbi:hypothetical protein, partial [Thalassovita aquimarina]|uniref:hypothetical protein n=1 Tax=Thalassovita aquimarina TaxID=2785917 RepID=UPI003569EA3F
LEISISPVEQKPVYAKDTDNRWMAYVRVDDENILANVIQLRVWKEEHKTRGRLLEFTRKEQILLETLQQTPRASLSRILRDTGFRRNDLEAMIRGR